MPQYEYYTVPIRARYMTFGQLFVDCYHQLKAATPKPELQLFPLISDPINMRHGSITPSEDVPEPILLGDLVKLLRGSCLGYWNDTYSTGGPRRSHRVTVKRITDLVDDTVNAFIHCAMGSKMLWAGALVEEWAFHGKPPSIDSICDQKSY